MFRVNKNKTSVLAINSPLLSTNTTLPILRKNQPSILTTSPLSVSYTTATATTTTRTTATRRSTFHKNTCELNTIRSMKHLALLVVIVFAALFSPARSALPDDSSVNSSVVTTTIVLPSHHFISPSNNDSSLVNGTVSPNNESDVSSGVTTSTLNDEESPLEDHTTQVIPFHLKGKCLMKDTCDTKTNILGDVYVPCVEAHDPHPLDEDTLDILKSICPNFFRQTQNPLLCCSSEQVEELKHNMQIALTLGLSRCPSCSYNWRLNLCEMTCSPIQSDFIKVVNSTLMEDGRSKIEEVEIHMNEEYPIDLFNSCKGVQGLATGQTLIDVMCGGWGKECTGERWLGFIGTSVDRGGQSPFQMTYVFHGKDEDDKSLIAKDGSVISPLKTETFSCSQKPSPKEPRCSCTDCEETCRLNELPKDAVWLPEESKPIEVFGITGTIASSILLFLFSTSVILTYFSLKSYNRRRTRNRKFFLSNFYSFCLFIHFHFYFYFYRTDSVCSCQIFHVNVTACYGRYKVYSNG